ncbi:MAG: hypothetical protein WBC44_21820 [Planctomycetaceae bacterium]
MPRRVLGGLACEIVESVAVGDRPSLAVILCHGYGAPADDLVPIGAELLKTDRAIDDGVRFYFPAAPLDLGPAGMPGGRAWWPIDMMRLVLAAQSGQWDSLRTGIPGGLNEAREHLTALIRDVQKETGLSLSRFVLGGFSQGAMLSADVALRLPEPVGALCLTSGSLVAESEWRPLAARQRPLRVVLSHGRQDPVLPYAGAEALRDLLVDNGHDVEFLPFDGGHTIPWPALHAVSRLLAELAGQGDAL